MKNKSAVRKKHCLMVINCFLIISQFFILTANFYTENINSSNSIILISPKISDQAPSNFTLTSNKNYIAFGEQFTLSWTPSDGAKNYSIFQSTEIIISINNKTRLIISGLQKLEYSLKINEIDDDKDYLYFVVVAYNNSGYTLSNNVKIFFTSGVSSYAEMVMFNPVIFLLFTIIIVLLILGFLSSTHYHKKQKQKAFYLNSMEILNDLKESEKRIQSSKEIINKQFNNSRLINELELVEQNNETELEREFELTSINENLLKKIDQFKWPNQKEKEQFISELIFLSPDEREEILNYMFEKANKEELFSKKI
ncbi:MAG: hypothetical protein ACTSVV_05150 [Promethearchaeota archaeon]